MRFDLQNVLCQMMRKRKLKDIFRRFGFLKASLYIFIAFIQNFCFLRIYLLLKYEGQILSRISNQKITDVEIKMAPICLSIRSLNKSEQEFLSNQPEYDIEKRFLKKRQIYNDVCIGVCAPDKVLAYGWFSQNWTEIDNQFHIKTGHGTIYVYKVFTLPEFRGKHLITLLLPEFSKTSEQQFNYLALVEIQNFSSLRGFTYAKFKPLGWILLFAKGKKRFIWTNSKIRNLGLRFSLTPPD